MMASAEDFQMIPDIDSEEDNPGELTLLGLKEENLPPEFQRTYDELNEDEKALHQLKKKMLNDLYEEGHRRRLEEELIKQRGDNLASQQKDETPIKLPTNLKQKSDINEILKELNDFDSYFKDACSKGERLRVMLKRAFADRDFPSSSKAKLNLRLRFAKSKLTRMLEQTLSEIPYRIHQDVQKRAKTIKNPLPSTSSTHGIRTPLPNKKPSKDKEISTTGKKIRKFPLKPIN